MMKWILTILVAGLIGWFVAMGIHAANAEEQEAGPRWKIVVTLDGAPGKQELTYGNTKDGVHWFATEEECQSARKGGDKDFAKALVTVKKMQADMLKQHVPIEVKVECRPDNSI